MIKFKHVTYLILMWVIGFLEKTKAQDFLRQSLGKVEHELKSEKAKYDLVLFNSEAIITLVEGGDTSVWKFDANDQCYEYTLILNKSAYGELTKHLESVGQMVMRNAWLNRKDNTITYLSFQDDVLVVNTKPFDANASTPPVLVSSSD